MKIWMATYLQAWRGSDHTGNGQIGAGRAGVKGADVSRRQRPFTGEFHDRAHCEGVPERRQHGGLGPLAARVFRQGVDIFTTAVTYCNTRITTLLLPSRKCLVVWIPFYGEV